MNRLTKTIRNMLLNYINMSHTIEFRFDCDSFEPKQYKNECGDCQTDGHYLCKGCRNIASFEDMDIYDNKLTYYFDDIVRETVANFLDQILESNVK